MKPGITIEGVGVVGGFGSGVDALEHALESQQSAVKSVAVKTSQGPVTVPVYLADTAKLVNYIPKRALRRIDHYSRMALLASYMALDDAGALESDKERLGIVVASGYGAALTSFEFMDSVIDFDDPLASPTLFSNSVHNAAAAHLSIFLKARGPSLTVSQFEMSVPSALISAIRWLEEDRVDRVLFGGVDEYCEVLGYCRRKMFGEPENDSIEPFEFGKQSSIAGEGAVFFLLSNGERTGSPYGQIDDVIIGNIRDDRHSISGEALLLLGADGNVDCGRHYKHFINQGTTAKAYSPLYGSFPVGQGFDLAAAALSMKSNRIYDPPCEKMQSKTSFDSAVPGPKRIYCIKTGNEGEYGLIELGAG